MRARGEPLPLQTVYWFLPAAFALHDTEELLTMPAWVARNRAAVGSVLDRIGLDRGLLDVLPDTPAKAGLAIGFFLVVFLGVTAGANRYPHSTFWRSTYAGLLGAFFLHGFTHLFTAFAFGGYTPGVASVPVIVLPVSLWIYRQLLRRRVLDRRTAIFAALAGLALFVPGTLLALRLAASLASR